MVVTFEQCFHHQTFTKTFAMKFHNLMMTLLLVNFQERITVTVAQLSAHATGDNPITMQ